MTRSRQRKYQIRKQREKALTISKLKRQARKKNPKLLTRNSEL